MAAKTVVTGHKANLETLKRAFHTDDVGLVECQLKSTGEKVAVLCAFQTEEDGEISFIPFAMMFNGNPYELLNPPNPDGGFFTE